MFPSWYGFGWAGQDWQSQAPFAQHPTNILLEPPVEEPITLDQAKLRAGLDWATADPRDAMMSSFIAAARQKVEADTGLALLAQTRRVLYDVLLTPLIVLPAQARPVLEVISLTTRDYYNTPTVIDPSYYDVDLEGGRIYVRPGAPVYVLQRRFQGWEIDLVAGRVDVADLTARDPSLVQAVGMLTAHYATLGRDLAIEDRRLTTTPHGYDDLLAGYIPVAVI